jgi:Gly-Xaa carboxypeptidase
MIGLPSDDNASVNKYLRNKKLVSGTIAVAAIVILFFSTSGFSIVKLLLTSPNKPELCTIHDKIVPPAFVHDNSTVLKILHDKNFRLKSVEKLAGAVQVDTQIGDNQPDVDDAPELWSQFKKFHKYLETTFPTVYEHLEVDKVNTYGLVFTWKGTSKKLKPLVLTAHQDEVPVQKSTLDKWTYPPFSGTYDGTWLYGRGSSDCKNVLIAIMESIELLIEQGFKPERTVIAAFGFDEESSGIHGASHIAKHLEDKYGSSSIYAIVDEGTGLMTDPFSKQIMSLPAVGEKGYTDVVVNLTTPGGHSSVPPDHTSIGIMSELAYIIEKDQYSPILSKDSPFLKYMQCGAVHGHNAPSLARKAIVRAGFDKYANKKVVESLSKNPLAKYLIQTSQAIDIIFGGEKANALPEHVQMTVNHRIAVESTVEEVHEHFSKRVVEVAKRHGLGVVSFGKKILKGEGGKGEFIIDSNHSLQPAPVSPSSGKVWDYLGGTIRHVFEDLVFTNLTYPIVTAPSLMPANTDTRYYWHLTKNIFRFSPFYANDIVKDNHIHSVDEKVEFDAHLQLLTFFYEYIQNVDTADAGQ